MRLNRDVDYPLLAMLSGFTLQWVDIGPIPIAQAAFVLSLAFWLLNGRTLPVGGDVLLFKVYAIYTGILALRLVSSEDIGEGASAVARSGIYGILAYLFYSYLRSLPERKCLNTLRVSVFFVFPLFFLFFIISAQLAGVNIIKSLQIAVLTGNPNLIQFQIFQVVLNNGVLDEDKLSSAARHGIMISLMTAAHIHIMLRDKKSAAGTAICALIYLLVFMSLSRSSILGLSFGVLCIAIKQIAAHQFRYTRYMILILGIAVFLPTSGILSSGGLSSILEDKFVGDIVDNPRVYEYSQIFNKIDQKVVLGWGTGTSQNIQGLKAQYPHNFLTYSWHQLGVIGFFCALTFMLLVVAYIIMGVLRSSRYARCDRQRSGLYMVSSTLLCIVLVRLLFAKAGLLAVPEWVALAIALYFYRIAQLGVAQSSPSGIWDSDKRDDSIKLA